jgi:hypothetical protein
MVARECGVLVANRRIAYVTNGEEQARVYYNPQDKEYVVKLKGRPNADYFTDDKMDAVKTAFGMVGLDPRLGYEYGFKKKA